MDTSTLIDLTTKLAVLIACLPVLAIALLFPFGFGRFILSGGDQARARSGQRLMWAAAIVAALATALYAGIYDTTRHDTHTPTYELACWTSQTGFPAITATFVPSYATTPMSARGPPYQHVDSTATTT